MVPLADLIGGKRGGVMKKIGKYRYSLSGVLVLCILLISSLKVMANTVSSGDVGIVVCSEGTVSQGDIQMSDVIPLAGQIPMSVSGNDAEDIGVNLSVPTNIDFMIDPWGLAGKGQIYSADFVICNEGECAGVLYLHDISACLEDVGDIFFVDGKEDVYSTNDRNVNLKMVFSTGEEIVLTEACSELEIPMDVGEELAFHMEGNVNEKAAVSWAGVVVQVSMKYSWGNVF